MNQAPATEDYYATLGVAPRSEAAAIRSAYLALMRRYHPDKNDSPEALDRAHAIIAAFAVIGDAEKRLHYDWGRRRAAEAAAQPPPSWLSKMPRALVAAVLVLLVLVPLAMVRFAETPPAPVPGPAAPPARIAQDARLAKIAKTADVAKPATAATPVAAKSPLPVPAVKAEPLPAATRIALVAPRPAEPAAAQPRSRQEDVAPVAALAPQKRARRAPPPARNDSVPQPTTASASAKCRLARPGAEAAICNNEQLAALDRSVVAFYNQSLMYGAAANRGALLDSRNNFLARREACRTDACLKSVHLGHLRELSAIVEKPSPAPTP